MAHQRFTHERSPRTLDPRALRVAVARVSRSPSQTERAVASSGIHADTTHARRTTIRAPPCSSSYVNALQRAATRAQHTSTDSPRHASARGLLVDTPPHRPAPLLSSSKRPPARRSPNRTHTDLRAAPRQRTTVSGAPHPAVAPSGTQLRRQPSASPPCCSPHQRACGRGRGRAATPHAAAATALELNPRAGRYAHARASAASAHT